MNKLIFTILVCSIICAGCLEDISTNFYSPSLGSEDAQVWSLQAPGQKKPCTRKSEKSDQEDQWIPSYSSRVTHHLSPESLLQPQALKNEEYLKESNPDTNIDLIAPSIPERRSLNAAYYVPTAEEDDCDDEPASPPLQKSATTDAIKLIKSCLKSKQQGSRRSMSNPVSDTDESSSDENEPLDTELSRKAGELTGKKTELRSKDTLLNPRVCYACSTATNPSCWEPDRRTTVKYCTMEKSCVTKSFGSNDALTVIRDCADSCEGTSVPGIEPKFNKCKVCHSDLCNGAFSINTYNIAIILIISFVKCTFY